MILRVFVVDDEAHARRKMLRFLKAYSDIQIAGEAADGKKAVVAIADSRPHLVFLDVQMPAMDGFDVLEALSLVGDLPQIVFVTAHDRYALRAFEVHALDYLLKPFDEERLARVLARARTQIAAAHPSNGSLEKLLHAVRPADPFLQRLFVRENERAFFVPVDSILWIEAARNYLVLHSRKGNYILRGTLDALEKRLDPRCFVRVNRSGLVRIDCIQELRPWSHGEYDLKLADGNTLRWSRLYVRKRPELLAHA